MLKDTNATTLSQFLTTSFSRVSPAVASKICETAGVSTRANPAKIGRHEADKLFHAIMETKISAPSTDCISPIGEELLLKGLHHVVPGEFYVASTRPPAVYRGNPFLIEVALAYGGMSSASKVPLDVLGRAVGRKRCPHAAAVSVDDVLWPRQRGGRPDHQGSRHRPAQPRPAS